MPWPVRCGKSGHLVVGAEAGVGDHLARGRVDRLARRARLGRGERRRLRACFSRFQTSICRARRLAEHGRARDVRLVAVHRAAVVDLDDVAFAQLLRLDAAVRERGVLAEASPPAPPLAPSARYAAAMLARRSPCVMPSCSVAKRGRERCERDVVGALHQRDLGRRLDHAAAGGDGLAHARTRRRAVPSARRRR